MGKHRVARAQGRIGVHSQDSGKASVALGPGTPEAALESRVDSGSQQSRPCRGQTLHGAEAYQVPP